MSFKRPKNVIWITTDHMRYDCIGAHGNSAMHTPTLDRLVREGVSFDNCFCQNPLCMPSRASFMTGLYPQQVGVTHNGHDVRPDFTPTVATAFKAGAYQTAQIGKLHFQSHEDNDLDPRARHDYGFDVFWLAEEPGPYEDAYMTWLRTEYPDLVNTFRVPRSNAPERIGGEKPVVLDAPWQASFSGWVATQTCRYLSGNFGSRPDGQFVHMGFYAPHPPLNPTREMFAPYQDADIPPAHAREQEWTDKPSPLRGMLQGCKDWSAEMFREYRRHFYAMVTGVDMGIAQVMNTLEEQGTLDDTLIVFSSDHGDMCGDHNMVSKGASFFDEIMHLPLVLFWPNGLGTAGRRIKGLVEMVDVLPTLLGLTGTPVPRVMAGRNYAPSLLSGETLDTRDDVYAYHHNGQAMLRTDNHKYIRYDGPGNDFSEVLYDLNDDPHEVVNHAEDSAFREVLIDMRNRMLSRTLQASASPQPKTYRY